MFLPELTQPMVISSASSKNRVSKGTSNSFQTAFIVEGHIILELFLPDSFIKVHEELLTNFQTAITLWVPTLNTILFLLLSLPSFSARFNCRTKELFFGGPFIVLLTCFFFFSYDGLISNVSILLLTVWLPKGVGGDEVSEGEADDELTRGN